MTELRDYLRLYMNVTDGEMDMLASLFYPAGLEKGEYFLRAGKVCEKFSFHRSGLMRIYASHGEKDVTQWISFKGNFISDLGGLICDQPSRFNIRALTAVEMYTIDKADYLRLPQLIPNWAALERVLITKCFGFMETRIFSLLSMSGNERYQYLQEQNPDLFHQVPLKYLASMMGMTPESLSRIRKNSM